MLLSDETISLAVLFLIVALLYASVGQAGASGYPAAMGLCGMSPIAIKTTALALNLLVAGISTVQFWRLGLLSLRVSIPLRSLASLFPCLAARCNFQPPFAIR